jgi:nitrite reductase (NADH) large subunit
MRQVIIGNGAAGNAAAAAIWSRDPAAKVLILSAESQPAYFRPLITNLIDEVPSADLFFQERAAGPPQAEVHLGTGVLGLEAEKKQLTLEGGQTCFYDRLLLATGASPIVPDIPGWPGPGTFVLRTLADARALAQAAQEARSAVVIGAGRVGLKAALSLRQAGLKVSLVEQGPHVAPMQFDEAAGEILGQALEAAGFGLCLGKTVAAVTRNGQRVQGAVLEDGRFLEAEVIMAAVGVRPNVELAQKAGLAVNQGIVVDRFLRTSAPEIYAAGDVAETTDLVTGQSLVSGLWTNAVEMGRLAGSNMAGAAREYPGAWGVCNSLEVAGIPTVALGLTNPVPKEAYEIYQTRQREIYRKLVCQEEILVGALLIGDIDGAGVYAGLIKGKTKIRNIDELVKYPRRRVASRLSASRRRG